MEAQNVLTMKAAKRFVLGGRATITITNGQGDHFTYRIRKWNPKDRLTGNLNPNITKWFVGVLTDSDNESAYSDLGELDQQTLQLRQPAYSGRRRPYVSSEAKSFKVAVWMFAHIAHEQEFTGKSAGYSVRHSGRCGRCARKLTTPESIDTGFGPECSSVLGIEWKEYSTVPEQQPMLPV
jgi:hypothetical protein